MTKSATKKALTLADIRNQAIITEKGRTIDLLDMTDEEVQGLIEGRELTGDHKDEARKYVGNRSSILRRRYEHYEESVQEIFELADRYKDLLELVSGDGLLGVLISALNDLEGKVLTYFVIGRYPPERVEQILEGTGIAKTVEIGKRKYRNANAVYNALDRARIFVHRLYPYHIETISDFPDMPENLPALKVCKRRISEKGIASIKSEEDIETYRFSRRSRGLAETYCPELAPKDTEPVPVEEKVEQRHGIVPIRPLELTEQDFQETMENLVPLSGQDKLLEFLLSVGESYNADYKGCVFSGDGDRSFLDKAKQEGFVTTKRENGNVIIMLRGSLCLYDRRYYFRSYYLGTKVDDSPIGTVPEELGVDEVARGPKESEPEAEPGSELPKAPEITESKPTEEVSEMTEETQTESLQMKKLKEAVSGLTEGQARAYRETLLAMNPDSTIAIRIIRDRCGGRAAKVFTDLGLIGKDEEKNRNYIPSNIIDLYWASPKEVWHLLLGRGEPPVLLDGVKPDSNQEEVKSMTEMTREEHTDEGVAKGIIEDVKDLSSLNGECQPITLRYASTMLRLVELGGYSESGAIGATAGNHWQDLKFDPQCIYSLKDMGMISSEPREGQKGNIFRVKGKIIRCEGEYYFLFSDGAEVAPESTGPATEEEVSKPAEEPAAEEGKITTMKQLAEAINSITPKQQVVYKAMLLDMKEDGRLSSAKATKSIGGSGIKTLRKRGLIEKHNDDRYYAPKIFQRIKDQIQALFSGEVESEEPVEKLPAEEKSSAEERSPIFEPTGEPSDEVVLTRREATAYERSLAAADEDGHFVISSSIKVSGDETKRLIALDLWEDLGKGKGFTVFKKEYRVDDKRKRAPQLTDVDAELARIQSKSPSEIAALVETLEEEARTQREDANRREEAARRLKELKEKYEEVQSFINT